MDAETAAALGDVDEAVDEVGEVARHGGELVDHDHEARHRLGPGARCVVLEVGRPCRSEESFTATQLRVEAHESSLREPLVEIRHETHRVGEIGARIEGASALVVDEDEVAPRRVERGGEGEHERAQELGLARPGGPADEGVGPVPT